VFVYKLIAADTVEERILDLQQRKAELANIMLNAAGETGGFDERDIDFLFGAGAGGGLGGFFWAGINMRTRVEGRGNGPQQISVYLT
jgi:hypothetical protein